MIPTERNTSNGVFLHDVQASLLEAQTLHRRGALAAAEARYRAILIAQPRHAKALHLLGVLVAQSGRPEAAVELISRSLLENASDASAHFDLAGALVGLKRQAEAVISLERALQLRPDFPQALINRGNA